MLRRQGPFLAHENGMGRSPLPVRGTETQAMKIKRSVLLVALALPVVAGVIVVTISHLAKSTGAELNRGSSLLAVKLALTAVLQYRRETSMDTGEFAVTNLLKYGLEENLLQRVTVYRGVGGENAVDPNRVLVLGLDEVRTKRNVVGRYAGLASGAVVLIPTREAVLGAS